MIYLFMAWLGKDWIDMYRKAISLLVLGGFVFMACFLCVKEVDMARLYAEPAQGFKLELCMVEEKARKKEMEKLDVRELSMEELNIEELSIEEPGIHELSAETARMEEKEQSGLGIADVAVSGQRVIDIYVMEQQYKYTLSEEDLEVLLRIVEAEAGTEDEEGKLLVANVVLNRVESSAFPDTVTDVVFQNEKGVAQFSPVSNGSYYKVEISDETISAVGRALMGEDISEGALYFVARKYAGSSKMKWFDEKLTYLFLHGGHEFFK